MNIEHDHWEEARKQIAKINFLRRKRFRKIAGHLLAVQYLEEFSYRDSHTKDIYGDLKRYGFQTDNSIKEIF